MPYPRPWQRLMFFCIWIWLLWTFYTNGIKQHVAFCVWLLPLNIVFSRTIHLIAHVSVYFSLWLNNSPCIDISLWLSIYLLVNKWAVSTLRILDSAAMKFIYKFVCKHVLILKSISRTAICDKSMFNFWGNSQAIYHAVNPLCIPSSSAWVLSFLYILTNTCYCFIVGEASIQVLFLFLNCFVVVELSIYILDINPLSNICCKFFSNSMGRLFTLLIMFFDAYRLYFDEVFLCLNPKALLEGKAWSHTHDILYQLRC